MTVRTPADIGLCYCAESERREQDGRLETETKAGDRRARKAEAFEPSTLTHSGGVQA